MNNRENEKLSKLFGTGFVEDDREPEEEFEPDTTPISEPKIDEIEAELFSRGLDLFKKATRHVNEDPTSRGYEVAGKILENLMSSSHRIKARMNEEKRAIASSTEGSNGTGQPDGSIIYKGSLADLIGAFKEK